MTPYNPSIETARLAPAAVCCVASRILRLRAKVKDFPLTIQKELEQFIAPIPFETELLSGKIEAVDNAIYKTGESNKDAEIRLENELAALKFERIEKLQREIEELLKKN